MSTAENRPNAAAHLVGALVALYALSIGPAGVYFNWQYATEHGFWSWLCFGELVATAKAIVWPLWLFWH